MKNNIIVGVFHCPRCGMIEGNDKFSFRVDELPKSTTPSDGIVSDNLRLQFLVYHTKETCHGKIDFPNIFALNGAVEVDDAKLGLMGKILAAFKC